MTIAQLTSGAFGTRVAGAFVEGDLVALRANVAEGGDMQSVSCAP